MAMATTTKTIRSITSAPIKQVAAKRLLWVLNFSSAMCNASTVGGCGRLDTFTHTDWDSSVLIPACIVKLFGLSSNDRKEYDRLGTKCRNIRLSWLDLFRLSWAQVATILLAQTLHPRAASNVLHGIKKVCNTPNRFPLTKTPAGHLLITAFSPTSFHKKQKSFPHHWQVYQNIHKLGYTKPNPG